MADAYFRVRHKPVATLTSCGPGSCNIIMPLACALTNSSAMLAITANVPTQQFNRSPFQEINRHYQADFVNIVRPVVKRSFQPTRVDMLPLALRQAMTAMLSGRPGPVNIDVPFNVFQEEDDVEAAAGRGRRSIRSGEGPRPKRFRARSISIVAAQRPVLFIGHGVTLSEAEPRTDGVCQEARHPGDLLAQRHGLPRHDRSAVARLYRAQRRVPANEAGRRADLVIAIGARFDDRSASSWLPGFSWNFPNTKLIHVDVDPDELGRNYPPDLRHSRRRAHVPAPALAELDRRNAKSVTKEWLADIAKWRAEWEKFVASEF